MHLSKLELYGFKSFANRTKLTFSPGITSFVGPNGCGKSNVVDAIRWVLGEQKPRVIRADKMEDVIFVGSAQQQYKNYAEVSIVMDNRSQQIPLDFSEITITRRLYKSGESEYYLNRVSCRLKDITEILATTSLSSGSYAIIGQGQVEEVIHSRPDDRRQMFEHAAGITLYKLRKREANRKLADTRANLTRVDDIIHELKSQRQEVADSADKARRYLELKQEADQQELNLWSFRHRELRRKAASVRQQEQQLTKDLQLQKQSLKSVEGNLAASASRLDELNGLMAVLEQNKARLADSRSKAVYQQELARQRRKDYGSMATQTEETVAGLKMHLAQVNEDIERNQSRARQLDDSLTAYRRAYAARDKLLTLLNRMVEAAVKAEKQAETLVMEAMIRESKTASQQQAARRQVEETRQLIAQAESEVKQLQEKLAQQREEALAGKERQHQLAERSKQLAGEKIRLTKEIEKAGNRLRELEQRRLEMKGKISASSERISMLQQMDDEYQGYAQGPRAVLQAGKQGSLQGIIGSVAQLIRVRDPRHSLAVETALGAAMQYIVCQKEEDCKPAIEMLKRTGQGRATFIPLAAAQSRPSREAGYDTAIVGRADKLVDFDCLHAPVVKRLLGNVLVVATMDEAISLARECGQRWRIVTLDGELVSRGLYTGGNWANKKPGLLQRRDLLAKLEAEKQQLLLELKHNAAAFSAGKEKTAVLREQLQKLEDKLAPLQEQANQVDAAVEQRKLVSQQLEQTMNQQLARKAELELRLSGLVQAVADLDSAAGAGEKKLEAVQSQREAMQEIVPRLRNSVQLWSAKRNRLQLLLVSLQNQADNAREKFNQYRQRRDELAREIARAEEQADEYRQNCADLERELTQLDKTLADNAAQAETVQTSLERQQQARKAEKAKIDRLNQTATKTREALESVQTALHDAAVKLARWEAEQEAMVAELGHKLGLTAEQALERADSDVRPGEANARLKRVRAAIADLGEVNLAAIQQHDRLEQRLDFLSCQRQDLVSAEQDITELIQQLNDKIQELFLATFTDVQEHFSTIFTTLFGGGNAYLSLTNAEDVLETGIEIYARPPGKRTQSLSLLSGGEKAMTAIALLFALQSVKPAPFCILDEIEAALDDVNIIRFVEYLRKLAEKMQFVLITHRRETMEYSDSLYGITLSEDGSSQPVSVTLNAKGDTSEAV